MGTRQNKSPSRKDAKDTRTKDHNYIRKYIGTIKFKSKDICLGNGVMISKNLVLTSASNVFDQKQGWSNTAFQFYLSSDQKLESCYSIIGVKYPFIEYFQDKGLQHNFALLRLSDVKKTINDNNYPPLIMPNSDISYYPGRAMSGFPLFQYDKEKDKVLVIESTKFSIRYDLMSQSYLEGFPIILDGNIIGIHCKLQQHKEGQFNYGRLVTPDLIKILKQWCYQLKGDMFSTYGQLPQQRKQIRKSISCQVNKKHYIRHYQCYECQQQKIPTSQNPKVNQSKPRPQMPQAYRKNPTSQNPNVNPSKPTSQNPKVNPSKPTSQNPKVNQSKPRPQMPQAYRKNPMSQNPNFNPSKPTSQNPKVNQSKPRPQMSYVYRKNPMSQNPNFNPSKPTSQNPKVNQSKPRPQMSYVYRKNPMSQNPNFNPSKPTSQNPKVNQSKPRPQMSYVYRKNPMSQNPNFNPSKPTSQNPKVNQSKPRPQMSYVYRKNPTSQNPNVNPSKPRPQNPNVNRIISLISQNPIANIKQLDLSTKGNVKLTDTDMKDLSKVRLDNLVELNLQNNRIKDKGLEILCQIQMPSLHKINIEDNGITINGLQHILESEWSDDIHYSLYSIPSNDNGYHVNVDESIPVMKKIVQTKKMETIDILIDEDLNKVLSAFRLLLITPLEKKEANNLVQNSKILQQQFVKTKAKNPKSIETILLQLKKITGNSLYFTNNSNVKTHLTSKIIFTNLYTQRIGFVKIVEKVQNFKFSDFKDNHKKLKQFEAWLFQSLRQNQGVDTSKMTLDKVTEGFIAHISDSIHIASTHNLKFYNQFEDNKIKPFFEDLQLSPDDFDIKRNYQFPPIKNAEVQWRGGLAYYQPVLGLRVGIKVQNLYDGNNSWLMMDGNKDEWAIAFHGPGDPPTNDKIKSIFKGRKDETMLKPGDRQAFCTDPCLNKSDPVGKGVYISPYFLTSLLQYSSIQKDTDFFIVFQCRVRPSSVKICKNMPSYWVINESKDLRPYGMVLFTKNQKQELEKFGGNYRTPEKIHQSIYEQQFTEATWKSTYKSAYDKFCSR